MKEIIILVILFIVIFLFITFRKEGYTHYEDMYQAYEIPFSGDTFIASGERPALGHYLRLTEYDGQSPILFEYENKRLKNNPCNVCMVKCLNPTSLIYKDKKDALKKCEGYCKNECLGTDVEKIFQEAEIESENQLTHDVYKQENYIFAPQNYYIQGGWYELPEWMENTN